MRRNQGLSLLYALFLAALTAVLWSSPATAQLFHDDHPGVWAMATAAWKLPGHMSGPDVYDCAGGPGGTMIVAKEQGYFEAVSAGYFDDYPFYAWVSDKKVFEEAAEGIGLGRKPALENTGDFRTYYVGFSCDTGMTTPGSHLFLMDLDGNVEKLVDVSEFTAVVPELCAGISEIGVAPDGTLFVMLSGPSNAQRQLVSVDLDGAPGERVTTVLSEAELIALFPERDGLTVADVTWGRLFAVDDQGRLFLHVELILENLDGSAGIRPVIARLDLDGTLVEMTGRENGSGDMTTSLDIASRPATGMQGGLEFDPTTGLIVGTGYGVWLMHPDLPGSATMIIAPEQVEGMASALVGDDWSHRFRFASVGGNCLAPTEDGVMASKMHTYVAFQYDTQWLDLDGDGLKGRTEAAMGTDPWLRDSDGGGIGDGLERVDITDPLDDSDDRLWGEAPDGIAWTEEHVDTPFTDTFEPYGLAQHGVALWDGSVLVSKLEDADEGSLYRFAGYTVPGQETAYPSSERALAADRLSNLYTARKEAGQGFYVARMTPQGEVDEAIPANLVASLVGEDTPMPRAWAVDPDGRVWAGFDKGQIIRYTPPSIAEPIYDGWRDLMDAGFLGENGEQLNYGCTLYLETQAMAWEPIHGVMLAALNRLYDCGMSGSYVSPVFVAIGYDNRVVRVGSSADYPEITSWKGGGDVMDIEPDWQGGFYLLLAHGVDRTLVHYDADWQATVMRDLSLEELPEGNHLVLNYAKDIIVTRAGEHYAIMGRKWGETPVHFVLRRFEPVRIEERLAKVSWRLPSAENAPHGAAKPGALAPLAAMDQPIGERGPGACRGGTTGGTSALVLLMGLLAMLLVLRRSNLLVSALVLLALAGCSTSSKGPEAVPDAAMDQMRSADYALPEVAGADLPLPPDVPANNPCQGINECEPTALAECTTDTSHRRCQMTPEGCWVWSEPLECPEEQTCANGVCQECLPFCPTDKSCGNDGCGGSCGECGAGLACCLDTFCGTCQADCTDRECGADGNGGSCGDCPAGETCIVGRCEAKGSGRCRDLATCLNDCTGWDQSCIDECEAYLDASSHARAATYMACISIHCVDCPDGEEGAECFDTCVLAHCAEPFVECTAQNGNIECKPMYECVFACEPGDQECMDLCYQSAFPSKLLHAIELELCVADYCDVFPPDPAGWSCWEDAVMGPCSAPFLSCMEGECDNSCDGIDCGLNDCLLPCGPPC